MDDLPGTVGREEALPETRVPDIRDHEVHMVGQGVRTRLLRMHLRQQGIDRDGRTGLRTQGSGQLAADEAGAACDKDDLFHHFRPITG